MCSFREGHLNNCFVGMDEDDIKHIRDSLIITEFTMTEEGEVSHILGWMYIYSLPFVIKILKLFQVTVTSGDGQLAGDSISFVPGRGCCCCCCCYYFITFVNMIYLKSTFPIWLYKKVI